MTTPHNWRLIDADVEHLRARGFNICMPQDRSSVAVTNLTLPPGRWTSGGISVKYTAVWIQIPYAFPFEVPGVGSCASAQAIHVSALAFNGRRLVDTHACGHEPAWSWLCFRKLELDPSTSRPLVTLLQIVEATITDRMTRT